MLEPLRAHRSLGRKLDDYSWLFFASLILLAVFVIGAQVGMATERSRHPQPNTSLELDN